MKKGAVFAPLLLLFLAFSAFSQTPVNDLAARISENRYKWSTSSTLFQSPRSDIITLQNAAAADGNGTAFDVGTYGGVALQIAGSFTATITFEATIDRSNWIAVKADNLNDRTSATTATAAGLFQVPLSGAVQFRARISDFSGGTVTVKARGVAGQISLKQSSGGGGGGGAPTDATYITQTSNGDLSAEQALSSLSTGIMRVANSTGVVTSLTNSAGIAANISDETGSGALVFGTSPALTTPNLGTPSAAVLTSATGLPISTGLTGAGTGVLTALGVNVGSAGAPVINGGALGTPSSGTATNITGLPLSTGVTGDLPFANFVQAGSAGFVGATGAGDYSHRTPTQVTAALDAFVGDSGSGGTKGLVPAPTTGDATKYLKGDGTWATVSGGGTPGGSDTQLQFNNAGSFGGISGATSNGTNVTFGSGNLLATSPVFTTDITTPIVKSAAGADLAANATAPAAANGASQAGKAVTITASPAVASLDTAGAAAGGSVTITAGAAARLTSGNANGGNVNLVYGAGIGTGRAGILTLGGTTTSFPALKSVTNSFSAPGVVVLQGDGTANNTSIQAGALSINSIDTTDGSNGTIAMSGASGGRISIASGGYIGFSSSANANLSTLITPDTRIRRAAAATLALGATAAASPVAQGIVPQDGAGTNVSGATFTIRGSLGTSQGVPGRLHLAGGAMIAASGTTQQTAVDRIISGATKVLTNNSAVTLVNVTAAADSNAGGVIDYCVEVTDATDQQYECGMVTYGVSNKGGVFSGNTATKFGNHQNATAGTLTVTFAISGANPALFSVNANSSLTPSTGFPRITYSLRNNTQQAVAIQ